MTDAPLTSLGKIKCKLSQMYKDSHAANYPWGLLGLQSEIMVTRKPISEIMTLRLAIKKRINVYECKSNFVSYNKM